MVVILIMILLSITLNNKIVNINLKVNDVIDSIQLVDYEGNEFQENFNGYNIVFYLSKNCSPCIEKINSINLFCEIFNNDEIKSKIIWEEKDFKDVVEEGYKKYSYALTDISLSNVTPSYYIIKNGKVVTKSSDIDRLINKIELNYDIQEYKENFIYYLCGKFNIDDSNEAKFIFFSDEISEKELDTIFKSNNLEVSSTIIVSNAIFDDIYNNIYDPENIIINIFKINHFPSIISLNDLKENF